MPDDQPPPIERPTCATCPYWHPLDGPRHDASDGLCCAHPPKLLDAELLMSALSSTLDEARPHVRDNPLTHVNRADDVADAMRVYCESSLHWQQPATPHDGWCGEHPDFHAYIQATRNRKND